MRMSTTEIEKAMGMLDTAKTANAVVRLVHVSYAYDSSSQDISGRHSHTSGTHSHTSGTRSNTSGTLSPHPQKRTWALQDISLEIRAGERIALIGANGSGKSTLARLIAGLEAPDQGSVELFGAVCKDENTVHANAYSTSREKIAMVFQEPEDQILGLSVFDDIAFGPENLNFTEERMRANVARELERFDLEAFAETNPIELSGGQQQKLVLASALAMDPELLILDEAASHLDAEAQRRLYTSLFSLPATLVYVTHNLEDALLAERIIVMQEGKIVADGSAHDVFRDSQTIASYGIALPSVLELERALCERRIEVPSTLDENELRTVLRSMLDRSQNAHCKNHAIDQHNQILQDARE